MHHKCQYSHKSIQVTKLTFLEWYNREAIKPAPKFGVFEIPTDQIKHKTSIMSFFSVSSKHNREQYF